MMERIKFMYFWLNYSGKSHYFKRILAAVKNVAHFFCKPSGLFGSDKLNLFLLSDRTQIDYKKD